MKIKKKTILIIIVIITIMIVRFLFTTSGQYYRKYSPDGQFSIYSSVYNYETLLQGREYYFLAGKVFLYDEVHHKIVDESKISRISGTDTADWTKESVAFKCEGHPIFKLPRKIKLPYTKKYKNGIHKVFQPNGHLSNEYQVLKVNKHIYRIGTEKYYNKKGNPTLVNTYKYFPDSIPGRINDSLLTKVTIQESFKDGKFLARRKYQHRLKPSKHCNCGTWVTYRFSKLKETIYPDCYDVSWECE